MRACNAIGLCHEPAKNKLIEKNMARPWFDEHCAPVDTLSAAPFAGAGAKTRSADVNTGAHDSDSALSYARREPSQSRSEARFVCLAKSSCAVATSRQAAQGHPVKTGRDSRSEPRPT